ncbi:MAG: response regulator [Magnetococcales bacterium]|nr:response regulator [Magnetococcales bacterium]
MNKILVVDDDVEFSRAILEILDKAGYVTRLAANGNEGLDHLRRDHFDLILLDLVLPGVDGMDVLRELRRINSQVRVILVTAFATVENTVAGMKLGAVDVLAKPFRMAEFITLIHRTMEEIRLEQKSSVESLDLLLNSLSNTTRRMVVERLSRQGPQSLSELMKFLEITDHTKLGFHLKNLQENGIIDRGVDRHFRLTNRGNTLWISLCNIGRKL